MASISDLDRLQQQADQVRASGALGKPGALSRLFDYLLERSLAGDAPKELEIAFKVFGKDGRFDVSQDSVVRVYVHKLRRRLDDYYARLVVPPPARISIPKGEYRLTIEHAATATEAPVQPLSPGRWIRWGVAAVALLAAVALGALLAVLWMPDREDPRISALRASPIWAPLLQDDLPITIVVGDYYLLGETDDSNQIQRLVREFFINSADDFVHQVEVSPKLMERYRNVNMTYLPTSSAFALQDVVPVLGTKKRVFVMRMSDLNGSMLRGTHIVYIGFISGLGILADPVFATSRISLGGTYDEIVDQRTNAQYRSTAASTGDSRYTDYGFFSTFAGPGRNRIVIIAGTRDTGVIHTAEALTTPATVADVTSRAGKATSFESLYEVYGIAKAGTNGKLLFVSPLDAERIWDMDR